MTTKKTKKKAKPAVAVQQDLDTTEEFYAAATLAAQAEPSETEETLAELNEVPEAEQSEVLGPPDLSYVDILNIATDEAMLKELDEKRNPIRPSAAGSCERELAFKLMEFSGQAKYDRKPISAETNRIFSSGHALEYDIIKQFRKHMSDIVQVRYTQQNLFFEPIDWTEREDLRMVVEGSNDFVFWSEKYKCVADVKTKKDKFSSWSASSWNETSHKLMRMKSVKPIGDILDKEGATTGFWVQDIRAFLNELDDPFFESNFLQLNLYACHQFMTDRKIDHACIIQYNKNDQRLREIRFKPDPTLAVEIMDKFKQAILAADEGNPLLARRTYTLGSIKCAFCDYKKHCWPEPTGPEDDPLKLYFAGLPKKYWATKISTIRQRSPEIADELETLRSQLEDAEQASEKLDKISERMATLLLQDAKAFKVKFEDGQVFAAREFKSPKPHLAMRRAKE